MSYFDGALDSIGLVLQIAALILGIVATRAVREAVDRGKYGEAAAMSLIVICVYILIFR